MPDSIQRMITLAVLVSLPTAGHGEQDEEGSSGNPVSVPVTAAQARAEVALTKKLNREQAAFAARQLTENAAAKKAFEEAVAARAATIARQQADYAAALAAHAAEVEQRAREHAAAMEKWRADVAACKAGDRSRCAQS